MPITPQPRKIAIIGASGTVGKPLLSALLASPAGHTITAIQRASSTSSFPPGVRVVTGDLLSESFLASAFAGQDAAVLLPPLSQLLAVQEPAVRAAAAAGVRYVFPGEFGPDPLAEGLTKENGLLGDKKRVRDLVEELGVSAWVSVVTGPWMEYGVGAGLWGVDPKERRATVWTGAEGRMSSATARFAGEAGAAALSLPEEDLERVRNGAVYAPSLRFTQRELLAAAEAVVGGGWTVEERPVREVLRECEEAMAAGEAEAAGRKFFVTHAVEGSGADVQGKVDGVLRGKMRELGLGEERLEEVIRRMV